MAVKNKKTLEQPQCNYLICLCIQDGTFFPVDTRVRRAHQKKLNGAHGAPYGKCQLENSLKLLTTKR
jgi:hypothetical protein